MFRSNKIYLSDDVQKQTLTFFTCKELKLNCRISKQWQHVTEDLLKQTRKQIYYTVGEPIYVADISVGSGLGSFRIRKFISPKELFNAFPNGRTRLFLDEKSALVYARSKQSGSDTSEDNLFHPAIYSVQYLGKVPELTTEEIEFKSFFDQSICKKNMNFFIVQSDLLLPFNGQIKVNFSEHIVLGMDPEGPQTYHAFPVVNFKDIEPPQKRCVIL